MIDFFEIEIAAGRIRGGDPRVAARIWMGSLQHFAMCESFYKPVQGVAPNVFVEGLVDMFAAPRPRRRG